ncbi:2'-5' RNA ligase family protein [Streptomyces sp. NPDC005918]|uniref:2'-5' RNA ligase family protein n=1 Tax=Streptomyces sp. NPDC005918 TaxID=3155454 RepID=UPI0033F098C9
MTPELDSDPRAFPCVPPDDLDHPGLIVEHDWRAFQAVERMSNHWDRPGWSDQQRNYYWMLTFPDVADLQYRAAYCQGELQHLGMDPVPADGLHVTMLRVGAVDQVSGTQIQQLLDLAQDLPAGAFHVLAHPLAGSRGAVRFSLTPWKSLVRLHASLSAIGEQVRVPGGGRTSAFRPHLGVAYNNLERPAAPVVHAVSQLRSLPPVALKVKSVDLVELRRQNRAYRWETIRSVPLRSVAAGPRHP